MDILKKIVCGKSEPWDSLNTNGKYYEIFIMSILFLFGVYHSVLYFGHQAIPNPDFSYFVQAGRELFSLQLPSDYKRAPVLGLLQVGLGYLVGGKHPDLTGGWLLNAILHPLNIVLLWLVGKEIIGKWAWWFAIIAVINPWVMQSLIEPIAETTLLFFILLTFFFIFRRSSWSYLFASITTMVRYEGAALILAAFVIDMITCKNKKERLRAFGYTVAAAMPLAIWMLGTVLTWQSQSSTYYLKDMSVSGSSIIILAQYINLIWHVGFTDLFVLEPITSKNVFAVMLILNGLLFVGSFAFGVVYGMYKRRWNILALLIFLLPYVSAHVLHAVFRPRYCVPVSWILLVICLYGLQSGWRLVNKEGKIFRAFITVFQCILLIVFSLWLIQLISHLSSVNLISPRSMSMPYVASAVILAVLIMEAILSKAKYILHNIVVASVLCVIVFSNQWQLVEEIGTGQTNIEFKLLANWYEENAKPGEKLLTTFPRLVSIFAPERDDSLLRTGNIKAEDPADFTKQCYDKDITYIAWDSRVGLKRKDKGFYKLWGLKNIEVLSSPHSTGPYEFITQIRVNEKKFINVFRLRSTENKTIE